LEIAFETLQLRQLCESKEMAENLLGSVASDFIARISDLRAAQDVNDIIVGNPTTFGDNNDSFSVDISDNNKIIFVSNHSNTPTKPNGDTDWENVYRIKITHIGE